MKSRVSKKMHVAEIPDGDDCKGRGPPERSWRYVRARCEEGSKKCGKSEAFQKKTIRFTNS